jgi:hypothetical protein
MNVSWAGKKFGWSKAKKGDSLDPCSGLCGASGNTLYCCWGMRIFGQHTLLGITVRMLWVSNGFEMIFLKIKVEMSIRPVYYAYKVAAYRQCQMFLSLRVSQVTMYIIVYQYFRGHYHK